MTIKIVADSSANLPAFSGMDYASVPLKIVTDEKEYVDDTSLNTEQMVCELEAYKGRSGTACPSVGDWLDSFGEAQCVFTIAITSNLSGSHNAACIAKDMYETDHPGRRVFVIDSLSAGPELTLIVEKLEEMIGEGKSYEEICAYMPEYQKNTGLLFVLESLNNFAANGRVSPAVAKIAGVLGIRIVGKASDVGTLEPTDKCRGEAKSLSAILKHLKESGLKTGKVILAHCLNESAANTLKNMIKTDLPGVVVKIGKNLGLCSYYAEKGGLLVGFEKM